VQETTKAAGEGLCVRKFGLACRFRVSSRRAEFVHPTGFKTRVPPANGSFTQREPGFDTPHAYLIAEMSAAECLPKKARDRKAIIAVRKKFETSCGQATNHWQLLGAVTYISGVGFFDIPHTQKPHAENFAELHPVTGIKFVSGCGA